ncbi:amidohydrolase [Priestia taiwanensis]|uniref:Deaminase n=1 Tax=Priestia taiwanensis TaxID=1347902 RepID=A0A917ARB4_9BACI|nr:amidohydrolase [Priestia taiwanensis]MBM7363205.1 cytosine/adenosine deaminase-related metal-dependent hydrolase [Priestia taiwanensis]GGE68515.1 deaminase [Priestia taiwanensis]
MHETYWLTNVHLESGYQFESGFITETTIEQCHLLIVNGIISQIVPSTTPLIDELPKKNARHLLALPSFIEKHCHLDKTLLGNPWRAVQPASSLFERFDIEKNTLPTLPTTMKERAENLLETLLQAGSTHVRTHVDIYEEVGIRHLETIQEALATYEGKLSHEIVAFPQHGLLRNNCKESVREALRNGAGLIGGVDPATVDGNMEASLHEMMELAVEANADVDLHLHDGGQLGLATIKRLAELTEDAGWQGRVAVSHAFALGDMAGQQAEEMAHMLAELDITIITSVPLNGSVPPVNFLHAKQVQVAAACDNIFDSWSPFGNGDILERAGRLAERFGRKTERELAETLGFITGGVTPLDKDGNQIWPKVGDEANIVFVEASCSAEAIARRAKRPVVMYKGKIVAGSLT